MHERDVQQLAEAHGFALCGVTDARPSDHREHIHQWLADDRHGEMAYLSNNLNVRLDPNALLDGAKSIICVADFHPHHESPAQDGEPRGRIARYAWGDDYHKIIKKRLFAIADALRQGEPEHDFRCTVDTAPLLEREHAHRAGIGWVGKHTLLIHPQHGSWMLLGCIVTTLPIEHGDMPRPMADHCGTCTRCIDACPTDCITPYAVDASRCISYLTLEHRGMIDPALHEPRLVVRLRHLPGGVPAQSRQCRTACRLRNAPAGTGRAVAGTARMGCGPATECAGTVRA